ncbi:MAG: PilN domain-containing protein [Bacillota bacterium]
MKREINLLPANLQRSPVLKTRSFSVTFLVILFLLLFLLGSVGFFFYLNSLERQIAQIQQELRILQPVVAKVQAIRKENKQKEQQIASLQSVLSEKIKWGQILSGIGDVMPKDLWLTTLKADEAGSISLQGNATSLISIGLLQHQLNQLPHLEEVSLRYAEITAVGDSTTLQFEMTGRLRQGSGNQGVGKTVP